MIKLGETSLLELLPRLLALIVPRVGRHYAGNYRNCANYEHVWSGFILTVLFACLMQITPWIGIGLAPAFFMHVVWKEIFHDAPKRINEEEWEIFWVNLIERVSGFVLGMPFVILTLLRG